MSESKEKKPCPLCHPRLFVVHGEQRVMWEIVGFKISTSVERAFDLLEHVQGGLLKEVMGIDTNQITREIMQQIKAANGMAVGESVKKEVIN